MGKSSDWGDSNRPGVLLVHGYLDSAATFEPLLSLLPDTHHYVSFDFPAFLYHHLYPGRIKKLVGIDPMLAASKLYYFNEIHDLWFKLNFERYYDDYDSYNGAPPRLFTRDQLIEFTMKKRGFTREQAEIVLSRSLVPAENGMYRLSTQPIMRKNVVIIYSLMRKLIDILAYKGNLKHIQTYNIPPILIFHGKKTEMTKEEKKFAEELFSYDIPNRFDVYIDAKHDLQVTHPEELVPHIVEFLNGKKSKAKL